MVDNSGGDGIPDLYGSQMPCLAIYRVMVDQIMGTVCLKTPGMSPVAMTIGRHVSRQRPWRAMVVATDIRQNESGEPSLWLIFVSH